LEGPPQPAKARAPSAATAARQRALIGQGHRGTAWLPVRLMVSPKP
jgi:hypothetical protein